MDKQKYQIKVIVYLRRQDGLLISRWNQEVKQKFTSAAVMTCEEYLVASEKKEKKRFINMHRNWMRLQQS